MHFQTDLGPIVYYTKDSVKWAAKLKPSFSFLCLTKTTQLPTIVPRVGAYNESISQPSM